MIRKTFIKTICGVVGFLFVGVPTALDTLNLEPETKDMTIPYLDPKGGFGQIRIKVRVDMSDFKKRLKEAQNLVYEIYKREGAPRAFYCRKREG